jgi:hypothetical protein
VGIVALETTRREGGPLGDHHVMGMMSEHNARGQRCRKQFGSLLLNGLIENSLNLVS